MVVNLMTSTALIVDSALPLRLIYIVNNKAPSHLFIYRNPILRK